MAGLVGRALNTPDGWSSAARVVEDMDLEMTANPTAEVGIGLAVDRGLLTLAVGGLTVCKIPKVRVLGPMNDSPTQ